MAPGARNKFGAAIFEPKVFWDYMYCIEESHSDIVAVGSFRHTPVIQRPEHCTALAHPTLRP